MFLGPNLSAPRAQTISDSDFVYVVPDSITVSDSIPTSFSVTLVLNSHTPAQALAIPLTFAGTNPNLVIDTSIHDTYGNPGITQRALGDSGIWTLRSSLVDNANQTILLGYVSLGLNEPLWPGDDSLVTIHFKLTPGGGQAVHVLDTTLLPPANQLTLVDPDAHDHIMQWQPARISILGDTLAGAPQICLAPTSLSFTGMQYGMLPPAQFFTLSNCGTGVLDWVINDSLPTWLSISPLAGNGDQTQVVVGVTGNWFSVGLHGASVEVSSPNADNSPQYLNVSYTIEEPLPHLCFTPTSLAFVGETGGPLPPPKLITVYNCGALGMTWYAYTTDTWLTLTGSPDWMDTGWVSVQVNRTDFPPGVYQADITLIATNADNTHGSVQVTLEVGAQRSDSDLVYVVPPVVNLPDTLPTDFPLSIMMDTHTPAQAITIPLRYDGPSAGLRIDTTYTDLVGNFGVTHGPLGNDPLWTIRTSLIDPIARTILLGYVSFGDPLPPSHDTLVTIHFAFDPDGNAGPHRIDTLTLPPANRLVINDSQAGDVLPLWTPATVFIGDSIPPPLICLSTTHLSFTAVYKGSVPPAQYVGIFNCGGGHLNWSASAGAPWLVVTPTAGACDSCYVTVGINGTYLTPGMYHASISASDPAAMNSPQTVSVDYQVDTVDSTGHDSDFFWIEPVALDIHSDVDTAFSMTVMLNSKTPASTITLPLSWAGPNANLIIDTTVEDGFGNRGVTQGPLGEDTLTWTIRSTLIDDDNRKILIGYVSFGDPLPPSTGALVSPHFRLTSGGAEGVHVLDTTTFWDLPITITDPNAVDYVPNWSPGFISIAGIAQPLLCLSMDSLVFYAVVNGALPPAQPFAVLNCGGGTLSWSVDEDLPWLSATPDFGNDSAVVVVSITTTALAPGDYSGMLLVTGPGLHRDTVHVLYTIADAPPTASDFIYLTPSLIALPTGVDTTFDITVMLHTDRYYLSGIDVPLTFAGSGPKVTIDTTISDGLGHVGVTQQRLGSDTAWESIIADIDNENQTILLAYIDFNGWSIGNVDDSLVTIHFKLAASPDAVLVKIDTTSIWPANHFAILDENATDIPVGWAGGTITSGTTGRDSTFGRPESYALDQNYPNPFNAGTKVQFRLLHTGFVELKVFNILGMPVRTLVAQDLPAGIQTAHWDGNDDQGRPVASGTYFYRLRVGTDFEETRGMTLLR